MGHIMDFLQNPKKKFFFFFLEFFFLKISAFSWRENRTNFQIFPIFISWIIVKIHRKLTIFRTKMTITRKIKIGRIWNLIFLSIQPIADLSSIFEKFQKQILFIFNFEENPWSKSNFFFVKSGQIYMKDLESAE